MTDAIDIHSSGIRMQNSHANGVFLRNSRTQPHAHHTPTANANKVDVRANREGYFCDGGFFIRVHPVFKAGQSFDGHYHVIDHLTLLNAGSVGIEAVDKESDEVTTTEWVKGSSPLPVFIPIRARCRHKITALEDGTQWSCMFARAEMEELEGDTDLPWTMEVPR